MNNTRHIRRFRTNPVEVALLSIVTLIFFHSIYTLFYDNKPFYHASLAQTTWTRNSANAVVERNPASTQTHTPALLEVVIECTQDTLVGTTEANGVKISGSLCGRDKVGQGSKLIEATITNATNHFSATVFPDIRKNEFSTDYIPLQVGENQFQVSFRYVSGELFSRGFVVTKK
jgi:hypothetical protein